MMCLPPLTVVAAGDGWVQLVIVLVAGAIGLVNWIIQQANKTGDAAPAGSDDSDESPAQRYARRRQAQSQADHAAAQYAPGSGYYQVAPTAPMASMARPAEVLAPAAAPLRPTPPKPPAAAVLLGGMNRTTLARLFVVSEILGPPRSLRDEPPAPLPAPADSDAAPAAPRDEPAR